MTPAERHDVVLILRRLSQPCPSGDEHEWRTCPRCLTIEELGHHKGRIFDLMAKAAAALAPQEAAPGVSNVPIPEHHQRAAATFRALATPVPMSEAERAAHDPDYGLTPEAAPMPPIVTASAVPLCSCCGKPLACPGDTAERIAGLEAMHEETLTRAEKAERERDAFEALLHEARKAANGRVLP